MESNARKILIISFVILLVVVVACQFFVASPIWTAAGEKLAKFDGDLAAFGFLKRTDPVWLNRSTVHSPPPAEAVNENLSEAKEDADRVLERIISIDNEFESFFKRGGREVMTGKGFRDLYQERVEKCLLPMLADNGAYNQPEEGGKDPIMVRPGLGALQDLTPEEQKALQKQAWIYQRIVASLMKTSLKTGPDGQTHPRLVRELLYPAGAGARSVAIEIGNCKKDDEVKKADKKTAADEPLFYGDKIKQIQVSFTVILDERRLEEFIEELCVYNPDRRFIPSVYKRGDDKKLKEMGAIKQITFNIQKAKITRIPPSEVYTVPDLEQRVNGNSREDALKNIEQIHRWVKLELVLNVLDYNPDYKKSKNRRS